MKLSRDGCFGQSVPVCSELTGAIINCGLCVCQAARRLRTLAFSWLLTRHAQRVPRTSASFHVNAGITLDFMRKRR